MQGKFVVGIAIMLFLGILFAGCGNEVVSPTTSETVNDMPLTLIVHEKGNDVIISSPNGDRYQENELKEAIKLAAQQGSGIEIQVATKPSAVSAVNEKLSLLQTAPPRNSTIKKYISNIKPVNNGVAIVLTKSGLTSGRNWRNAQTLGTWAMFEYTIQTGRVLPNYDVHRAQVQLEIYYHSWAYYFRPIYRFQEVNVSFGNLP